MAEPTKKQPTYFADEMCFTLTKVIKDLPKDCVSTKTDVESLIATIDTGDYVLVPKDVAKREAIIEGESEWL